LRCEIKWIGVMFTKNAQLYWNLLFKGLILLFLGFTIYRQIFVKSEIEAIWRYFLAHFEGENMAWLVVTVLLIPVNWLLEALKWRQLMKGFSNYPFFRVVQGILAGVTVGIFTPNRIGEYGGRILLLQPEHAWKGIIATAVGGFSQLVVLIGCGLLGLIFYGNQVLHLPVYLLYGFFFVGVLTIGFMLFCFYNIDLLVPIAKRIKVLRHFKKTLTHLKVLTHYTSSELSIALGISVLRYFVFSSQYYFMLHFFGLKLPLSLGLSGIATIYLLQSGIPLPPLIDVLARGELALFIWKPFSEDEISILSSTFLLFILNLIIPSLIGAVFIFKVNIIKSLGYENKPVV